MLISIEFGAMHGRGGFSRSVGPGRPGGPADEAAREKAARSIFGECSS